MPPGKGYGKAKKKKSQGVPRTKRFKDKIIEISRGE